MAEDHIGNLKKVRNELVRRLQASISALTEDHKHTEHQLDTLIRYEQAIEAIEHAITEEQIAAMQPLTRYED